MSLDEEYRRNSRIRQDIPIHWVADQSGSHGDGYIRDISVSGVLVELDALEPPRRDMEYSLQSKDGSEELYIPDKARLVWCRAMRLEKGKYMCGMEFVRPSGQVVQKLGQKIDEWFASIAQTANLNILSNYFRGRNNP